MHIWIVISLLDGIDTSFTTCPSVYTRFSSNLFVLFSCRFALRVFSKPTRYVLLVRLFVSFFLVRIKCAACSPVRLVLISSITAFVPVSSVCSSIFPCTFRACPTLVTLHAVFVFLFVFVFLCVSVCLG